jgi:hypothetical protein
VHQQTPETVRVLAGIILHFSISILLYPFTMAAPQAARVAQSGVSALVRGWFTAAANAAI